MSEDLSSEAVPQHLNFTLFVTGLVVWSPVGETRGAMIGVRSGVHAAHAHAHTSHAAHEATFVYETRRLAGLGDQRVPAPDPLVAGPDGALFARRVLQDEILWLDPEYVDKPEPLTVKAEHLLKLGQIDSRFRRVREDCLRGHQLEGTPAVSRLDFDAGTLSVAEYARGGPWRVEGPDGAASRETITRVASILKLELKGLRSLTVHSNRNPALRFSGKANLAASYTVEPVRDFIPADTDGFPHFESAFDVSMWSTEVRREDYCEVRPVGTPGATVGDFACPPSDGGG